MLWPCSAALLCWAACRSVQQNAIMLKAIPGKADARLTVAINNDSALVEIFSVSGIGRADLEAAAPALPQKLILRFHLRGLEELRFAYDEKIIALSLSSAPEQGVRQTLQQGGGQTQSLTAQSPYWMKVRVVAPEGEKDKRPLPAGYIEVEAPPDFLAGQHRKASLHWIDFYR